MAGTLGLLLEAKFVTKAFAGVHALKGVSFDLLEGEVHALVGENGAGKSTLIKIMTGALMPDSGTLVVHGKPITHNDPAIARSFGIAAIYQQPSLFPHLTVCENIALALETGAVFKMVNWKKRRERASVLLERIGASIDPEQLVSSLSMPEQQMVEIAKAIGSDAKILIMDEPTSSLSEREVDNLFGVIQRLRTGGAGIIYISHRLEEILSVADRVTVLRDGETIATKQRNELDQPRLISMMVGRELTTLFPERSVAARGIAFELCGVGNHARRLRNISISVRSGEILGVAGLVGSGRTELAETIFGLTPADSGEIRLRGTRVQISSPSDAIQLGIGYVPEDRRQHGVILNKPITVNTSIATLTSISHGGIINSIQERKLAERYVAQLRVKAASVYADLETLSGGNQQKIALARWLAIRPSVLILDEPTQGVDIGSKYEIHRIITELAESGVAIIMISSELPEILGLSDRIAVMHRGTIAGIVSKEEASEQGILAFAFAGNAQ
jgi:rhamnose transport system ATP-binding protein